MSGRVVVWLGSTLGKGFPLPVVLVVGAVVGAGLAVSSFLAGRAAEKKYPSYKKTWKPVEGGAHGSQS